MRSPQIMTLLILPMLLLMPGLAWACGGFPPYKVEVLDYLIFGVALASGFRWMVQWKFVDRVELSTAVYLSCYIGALGIGLFNVEEVTLNPGTVGKWAMFMIPFSVFYIRNVVVRTLLLAPQFAFAAILSIFLVQYETRYGDDHEKFQMHQREITVIEF